MKIKPLYIFIVIGILVSSVTLGFSAYAQEKPIKIGLMTDLTSFLSLNQRVVECLQRRASRTWTTLATRATTTWSRT